MKYSGSKEDIGISKVQGIIDLKADLRGYKLNGETTLKPVDPLFSEGITVPSHQESASFLGQNSQRPRDEVFEREIYRYVKDVSKVPSWFAKTKDNPLFTKSVVEAQRGHEVQYVSELYPDAGQVPRQYINDQVWATGSKAFITEQDSGSRHLLTASSSLSKHQRFKIDKAAGTANAFYGKPNEYSGDFNFPGGEVNPSLEYEPGMVDQELGLIPFCITTITPDYRTYLNFPAHLDTYDDNYTGDWDSVQYVGRAEKFYGYTGFTRNISLSFKVVAANPQNLANLYSRLNRLAGATAPSYGPTGLFMRGTLASITIGDLLRNQTGFINSVKLTWQQDYLWELGPISPQDPKIYQAVQEMYGIAKTNVQDGFAGEYYRVPQMLDVSLGFTPIEHGTVREDYNAYFVFDPKEQTPTMTGTPEFKQGKKEADVSIARPKAPSDDWIWDYSLSDGAGGWRMRRSGEVDMSGITIGRPGQFDSSSYNEQSDQVFLLIQ